MNDQEVDNATVAEKLARVAELLELQDANPFRVRSYRDAAMTIDSLDKSVAQLVKEGGTERLQQLPGIGESLASAIREIVRTGRLGLLQRLQAEASPEKIFVRIPGIGEKLASQIHDRLQIQTLEELERAAHDGRLEQIDGIGQRKAQGIRDALAGRLSQSATYRARQRQKQPEDEIRDVEPPPVDILLEIDEKYRRRAEAGTLKTIAPKRFNPDGEAWLPIMHTDRGQWSFTVLFSNAARAHELNKTHDWVVIYYETDGAEDQCTVVTEGTGDLTGKRVVRGRENECRKYYRRQSQ